MSNKIRIQVTDRKQQRSIDEHYGADSVLFDLKKSAIQFGMLPGYNSAIAVAEIAVASMRAKMFGLVTQTAAKAGVDLATHLITAMDGDHVICEPYPMDGSGGVP